MADTFDAGFEADVEKKQDDRPRGVSKKKLEEVDAFNGPKISIFWREHRKASSELLEQSLPREAVRLFCENIKDPDAKSYIVVDCSKKACKQVIGWIKSCIETQSIEKFPDVDEPSNDPFGPTIDVLIAANRLGVPAGSLSHHLLKRLNGCARKNLMTLDQVRMFYDFESEEYGLGLKAIACTSIFYAWWDARLDESVNPELMEELSDLRNEMQELDGDLHEACKNKEEEVRKKWEEKKAKKAAEAAGGDGFDNNNTGFDNGNAGFDDNATGGGWDNGNTSGAAADWEIGTTVATVGGWDDPTSAAVASNDWDTPFNDLTHATTPASRGNENMTPVDISAGKGFADKDMNVTEIKDWAEEMYDQVPELPQTVPEHPW